MAFGDVLKRKGAVPGLPSPPFVPGYDVVGVVDALGEGVDTVEIGDRVGAFVGLGGYAELLRAPADLLIPIPAGVTDAQAVASILNYGTAYQLLHRMGRATRGQTILVPGAAGGIGTALLQLAAQRGVDAVGIAAESSHAFVRSLGGDPITPEALRLDTRLFDVVYDSTGGAAHVWRLRRSLKRGGRLVSFGMASAAGRDGKPRKSIYATTLATMGVIALLGTKVSLYLSEREFAKRRARFKQDVAEVLALVASGNVRPVIAAELPLAQAAEAHRMLESGRTLGKVVLI
ncbi:MAG: zinc-binding dehydrogenase [Deltaproteobacteria bacterium]|nr:zinc-binding dehydrogenase [Nannocystaceae bacterium]